MKIAAALGLKDVKLGKPFGGDEADFYVMYKLRRRKLHPEFGASPEGWIYGVGYDLSKRWSIDIYVQDDWRFRGDRELRAGISTRY